MAKKVAEQKLDLLTFAGMVKKSKSYADLEKLVEKGGYATTGIKLRLAALRNGGLVIPQLEGEVKAKPATKSRKEQMMDIAAATGLTFDPKLFKERKPRTAKA